ncbi:MAG TPA: hypothetical protein VI078_01505 [bacterium]
MLKVTKGTRTPVNLTPKKRGRPPKVRPSVLDTMKANEDPDIRFMRDLTVNDRTEVINGDPNFVYRWCEESKLRTREMQGYEKNPDPDVKTHFDGNYMPPEGYDRRLTNKGGMVLCRIKKSLHEKRVAYKAEEVAKQSAAMEAQHVSEMRQTGYEVLGASDPVVVGGLSNGE